MDPKQKNRLDKILKGIEHTAKKLNIDPYDVNKSQFFQHVDGVTPWDIRIFGGLSTIKNSYFPQQNKDLAVIRQEKEIIKYVKQLEQKTSGKLLLEEQLTKMVAESLRGLAIEKVKVPKLSPNKGEKMTMEAMISDVHYGKKTDVFNLEVCRNRIREFTKVFLEEMGRKKKEGYNVEKVIVALIGDLIESYTMHGLESAAGCEFGNSQQVQSAITSLYYDLIRPIAETGVEVFVPCVSGNHDRSETNRTMQEPGLNNLTWIIYNSLEEYCKIAGLKNVTFQIARGSYLIGKVYENNILWEHGDNANANTKRGFEALMEQRARQNNVTLHFGRFGHYHEYLCCDRGRIIVNESVCGQDSYAHVKGFNTSAGQTINYYVKTDSRPTCFYYSFAVYLG
jgi:hypothetical protein